MFNFAFKLFGAIFSFFLPLVYVVGFLVVLFSFVCAGWFIYFRYIKKMEIQPSGQVPQRARPMLLQLFLDVPRRRVLDRFERETGYFTPRGIHMFCGEQGAGKTIAAVEMMCRLQRQFPMAKMITNFGVKSEDDELSKWQQLLDYSNGHKGVIVGIDEIQNWFMSGLNKLPEGMLEVATQNRKNNRILCCTAQVFTRVNKGLREQVTLVYNPHTFFGCFTVVIKRKPVFDSEGNVTEMKYRGMYCFTHTDELREAYDTYKVIHTLAKEGFKDAPVQIENKVVYQMPRGRK